MRLIQVRVPDEQVTTIARTLDDLAVDYVVTEGSGPTAGASIIEFPLPTDGVRDVLDSLRDAGLAEDAYVVVGSAETAVTEHGETLLDRYADDFDPLTRLEIRSKARDLSRDRRSYVAMIFLSALIATVGLLVESAAVIVGSMVIAPFVGPILTAGVGALTGDREMFVDSILYQGGGIVVAVVAAVLMAALVRWTSFVPATLAVTTIESMSTRAAPGLLAISVGLVAGGAAAYGLSTKGPTALIGVMIAAALIPTAAAVGISIVWVAPVAIVGASLLLVATVIAINVGVLTVLWWLGYRPDRSVRSYLPDQRRPGVWLAVLAVAVLLVSGLTVWGAAEHAAFERDATRAIEDVIQSEEYDALGVITIREQYTGPGPTSEYTNVTVVLSRTAPDQRYPDLPATLADRVSAETGYDVAVEVRYVTYHRAESDAG